MPPKPTSKSVKPAAIKSSTSKIAPANEATAVAAVKPAKKTATKKSASRSEATKAAPSAKATVAKTRATKTPAAKSAPKSTAKTIVAPITKPASEAAAVPPKSDQLKESLLHGLRHQLRQGGLLDTGRPSRIVLAFSGGGDSTALLHLMTHLRDAGEIRFVAAYYHHNWRGTPPPELQRVHKTCQRFRVPMIFLPPHSEEERNEHSARHYRYERLLQVARVYKADAVVTAHHEDDQIETLIFRLFRGTGLDGLEGIQKCLYYDNPATEKRSDIPVCRPLLGVSKEQLQRYLTDQSLAYFEDPSNQNTRHARNAIRHDLLPVVKQQFPQYRKALVKLSILSRGDLDILNTLTPTQWESLVLPKATPTVYQVGAKRSLSLFCQLNVPYQRRLVRHLLNGFHMEGSFETVERILQFLNQSGARTSTASNLSRTTKLSIGYSHQGDARFLLRSAQAFWVEFHPAHDASHHLKTAEVREAPLTGGMVTLPWDEGQALRIEPLPRRAGIFDPRKLPAARSKEILVNAQAFENMTLTLRSRRPGDLIQPMGMGGKHMKLKEFFISQHIPRELRDEWPVVAHENTVLWVPGVGLSEALRVTPKKSPTHTWMLGGTEDLAQMRTLKFLEDAIEDNIQEGIESTEALGAVLEGEGDERMLENPYNALEADLDGLDDDDMDAE
jgi:tRNA(Ile)-lysidine synthase